MKDHELQFYNRRGITIAEYVNKLCKMTDSEFQEELKIIDKEYYEILNEAEA